MVKSPKPSYSGNHAEGGKLSPQDKQRGGNGAGVGGPGCPIIDTTTLSSNSQMSQDSSDEDNKKVLKLLKEIKGRKIKKDKSEIRDLRKKMIDKESYINRLHKRISDDQMTKYQTDKRNAQANEMNEKLKNHILEEKLKLDEENAQLRMQIDRIKSEFVPGAKNPNIAPGQLASLNITSNQPNLGISPAEPVLVGYGTATNFSASVGGLSAAPGSLSTGICGVGSTAPPGMSLSSGIGVGMQGVVTVAPPVSNINTSLPGLGNIGTVGIGTVAQTGTSSTITAPPSLIHTPPLINQPEIISIAEAPQVTIPTPPAPQKNIQPQIQTKPSPQPIPIDDQHDSKNESNEIEKTEKTAPKRKRGGDVVDINIQGKVQTSVIVSMFDRVKYSLLWKLITDPQPENYVDDRIYIDRDYIIFQQVLNFLRNGFKKVKFGDEIKQQLFEQEILHWQIRVPCETELKLRKIYSVVPKGLSTEAFKIWKQLGPFNINDAFYRSKNANYDFDLQDNPVKSIDYQFGSFSGQFSHNPQKDERLGMGREIAEKGNKPGQIYEGQFSQDKKNGYGRYIYFDGDYYEGMFKDGKKSGWGTYQWGNGQVYEGEQLNGKRHGHGKHMWPDGAKYEGEYQNGMKHGKGKYHWPDASSYEGGYLNDMANGQGMYTDKNGKVNTGEWIDNKFQGVQ